NANTYQATPKQVTLSIARLKIYFSFVPEQAWIKQSLQSLGFDVLKLTDEEIIAQIPSWRTSDVKYDVCLIEELAKIYDYNKLPSFPPQAQISLRPKNRWLQFKRRSEEFFVHQGYYSVLNFGFISE